MQKKITRSLAVFLIAERQRLVLWTPVFLALGIGSYFSLPFEPPVWAGFLLLSLSLLLLYRLHGRIFWRWALIALALACGGFSLVALRTQLVAAPSVYSTLYFRSIQGRVEDIQEREKGQRLVLGDVSIERISPQKTPLHIAVSLKEPAPGVQVGDKVALKAILFPPPTPSMPGAYDFSRQYYYDRMGAVGYAPRAPVIIEHAPPHGFAAWLTELRLSIHKRILSEMSPEGGPVAAALMVGIASSIPDSVKDAMRDSGLYHVLSISGLHMSLAVGLLYVTLRTLLSLYPPVALRLPVKKIAALLGLLGAMVYLLLAGSPVPAVRSFIMVACVMLAVLFDRRGISVYSLAWAATLVLLVEPESLLGASFQLSFAATLAIVAFYERYAYLLRGEGHSMLYKIRIYFLGLVATSLVATLATTPLVIYHFNRFTLWGVAANMLMMPLASFMIMPAAVLAFLMMPFGLEAWPLHWLDISIGWMLACAHWFASMPMGAFAVPPLTFAGLLLTVLGGLWLCLMAGRWRLAGLAGIGLGMVSIAFHQPYDLIVSSDGKQVALRTPGNDFVFLKGKDSSYDAQSWLRYHGQEHAASLAVLSPSSGKQCKDNWCVWQTEGLRIAVSSGKDAYKSVCGIKADIYISDNYLDREGCIGEALRIDRKFLYRNGAVALRFTRKGYRVFAADDGRRYRPWSSESQYNLYHSGLYHSGKAAITKE